MPKDEIMSDPLGELPESPEIERRMGAVIGRLMAPSMKARVADLNEARRVCTPLAAEILVFLGEDRREVAGALARMLQGDAQVPIGSGHALPPKLARQVREDYDAALADEPADAVYRLDEKHVKDITDFRIDIFHDESKHRGRPHVRVALEGRHITISIEKDPEVLAGPRNLRGEAAAIRCVRDNRKRLKAFWKKTRPDDQKLPHAARSSKTATTKSKTGKKARGG